MFQDYTQKFNQIIQLLQDVTAAQQDLKTVLVALDGLVCFLAAVEISYMIADLFKWIANEWNGRRK